MFLPFALEDGSGRLTTEVSETFVQENSGFFADNNTVTSSSGGTGKIIDINYPSITTSVGATGTGLGGYLNADGFVSESSKKIQDSRFYQDFSYVVQVGQSIDQYKDAVKKLLHPIGLALFGEVQIQTILNAVGGDITDTRFLDLIILFVIFNFVDSVSVVPDFGLIEINALPKTGGSFSSPPQTDIASTLSYSCGSITL